MLDSMSKSYHDLKFNALKTRHKLIKEAKKSKIAGLLSEYQGLAKYSMRVTQDALKNHYKIIE